MGEAAPPKEKPRTIENTREINDNYVQSDDEEVIFVYINFINKFYFRF